MTVGGPEVSLDDELSAEEAAKQPFTFQVFKVVVLAALGGFLFGYDTGIVSGAMVFVRSDFELDDEWQEFIVSATILAAWVFSFVAGWIGDRYGRRKTVLTSSIVFTLGSILMGAANNQYLLLVGRLTVGAGVGLSSMINPLYIAELAPARIRGTLVTMNNLFITGGQAAAALIAVAFSGLPEDLGWRFMLGLGAVPSVIQLIGFITLPESPRWLIRENRDGEAYEVLRKMRGPDTDIEKEFAKMREGCNRDRRRPSAIRMGASTSDAPVNKKGEGFWKVLSKVIKDKYLRRALALGCVLQATQQLTGINTVMYYAATIIQMSGVEDKSTAVWMASITGMVNFLTTFIGLYAVDRLGRRKLTLISLFGVVVSLFLLSGGFLVETLTSPDVTMPTNSSFNEKCFKFKSCEACVSSDQCGFCYDLQEENRGTCLQIVEGDHFHSEQGWCRHRNESEKVAASRYAFSYDFCPSPYSLVVLVGLCVYLLFFGPGMGPMPWTVNSEIFPLWARTTCLSCTTSVNWFFNLLVSLTFLTLVHHATKEGAFLIYGLLGFTGFVYLFICLPETKGKNLEETDTMFRKGSAPRVYSISDKKLTASSSDMAHRGS